MEHEKPSIPLLDLPPKEKQDTKTEIKFLYVEKKSGNSQGGNLNIYWEQIKMLDEKVKEISCTKDSIRDNKHTYLNSAFRTCSLPSSISFGSSYDPVRQDIIASLEQVKQKTILQERDDIITLARSFSCVHDVFEVPKTDETPKTYEHQDKAEIKLSVKGIKKRIENPDLVSEENDGLSHYCSYNN